MTRVNAGNDQAVTDHKPSTVFFLFLHLRQSKSLSSLGIQMAETISNSTSTSHSGVSIFVWSPSDALDREQLRRDYCFAANEDSSWSMEMWPSHSRNVASEARTKRTARKAHTASSTTISSDHPKVYEIITRARAKPTT